jgi:hypothetical protein
MAVILTAKDGMLPETILESVDSISVLAGV